MTFCPTDDDLSMEKLWTKNSQDLVLGEWFNDDIQWSVVPKLKTNEDGKDYITADVNCMYNNNNSSKLWTCNAYIMFFVSHEEINTTKNKMLAFCFNRFSNNLNFGKISWMEDHFPNGYNHDWKLLITMNIRIASMVVSDFSIPKNIDSDVVLRVGRNKLYVDKLALNCFSNFFRAFLAAHNGDEIEMKDENNEYYCIGIVVDFLQLLYKQKTQIRRDNVESLLNLATRYDVKFMIFDCEEFLSSLTEDEDWCSMQRYYERRCITQLLEENEEKIKKIRKSLLEK